MGDLEHVSILLQSLQAQYPKPKNRQSNMPLKDSRNPVYVTLLLMAPGTLCSSPIHQISAVSTWPFPYLHALPSTRVSKVYSLQGSESSTGDR